jgi:HK97 family phage major capsid protein
MNLKELQEKLKKALLEARAIAEAAEQGSRDFTDEERQKVKGFMEEAGKLKAQIKQAEDDQALRKQIMDLGAGIEFRSQESGARGQGAPAGRGQTLGERFVESEQFKAWMKQVAPGGHIAESAKGLMSPPVQFRSLFESKALITGSDDSSAGAFVQTDYTGTYEPLGRGPLGLRDLISQRQTTSDLVEFVRQTAKVTQAAPVKESNVTTYREGQGEVSGEKPEGTSTWEKSTAEVKTIAVWIPATKRALSDAAQLRGIIDQELRDDLEEDLEDELIGGDGTGEHFYGIYHTPGILHQAWDSDILTTARKAITYLRVTGRARPTAWLVNPNDAELIDLLQDGNSQFYYGGPAIGGVQQLWRVRVVECDAVEEGLPILGDFRKAVLWDREQASIQISDSHADFFIRNMVAILAEMRAAFALIRPRAFCTVDFNSGS